MSKLQITAIALLGVGLVGCVILGVPQAAACFFAAIVIVAAIN